MNATENAELVIRVEEYVSALVHLIIVPFENEMNQASVHIQFYSILFLNLQFPSISHLIMV